MSSSCSPLLNEANCQALRLQQTIRQYQSALPLVSRSDGLPGLCRAEAWALSYQTLNGDFALDEPLAQKLVSGAQASAPAGGIGHWMKDYLLGNPESGAGIGEHMMGASVGPGNILANVNELRIAGNAAVGQSTTKAIQAGTQRILSGEASAIKINNNMTLYNANKSEKGLPRPRLRITGLRMQVVSPAFGESALRVARNGSMTASMRKVAMEQTQKIGSLAASSHWMGKPAFLNTNGSGAALTFLPSAGIDLYNSINRDLQGNIRWDHRRLLIDSAKSQSGNALGYFAGGAAKWAAPRLAVWVFGVSVGAAAPVILIGLFAGVLVQFGWNYSGMSDKAGDIAEKALGR